MSDDKPFHECGQQVADATTRMGEPGHDPTADWWCATCKAYLGDQEIGYHDPDDVARWLEQRDDPLCAPLTEEGRARLLADYDPPTAAQGVDDEQGEDGRF